MARVWLVLVVGLALSILGTLTATDAISLREVVYGVPVLSSVVFATRNAMGTTLAHTLEPLCALFGLSVMLVAARLAPVTRRRISRPTLVSAPTA